MNILNLPTLPAVACCSQTQIRYAAKLKRPTFTKTWRKTSITLTPVILIPRTPSSHKNRRVLGKIKSETGFAPLSKFVGFQAKMYSLKCDKKSYTKVKDIQKRYVKKHVRHECFLEILKTPLKLPPQNFAHSSHPTTL